LLMNCITDNRNRTVAAIRHVLTKHGGSMGSEGSVSWQFTRKSYFTIPIEDTSFEELFEIAVETGADDVVEDDEYYEIIGPVEVFKNVHDKLNTAGIKSENSGLRMDPNQEVELNLEKTLQVMKVIDTLEELDDIQAVYSNLTITDDALEGLE